MYLRPAFASGSRILYMSRPSTPAASLARFSPSFASRASAASAACCAIAGGNDDDAVVVGNHHVPRIDQRAGADHRNVHRAERCLDRALGADRPGKDRELHFGQVLHVAHAAVDDQALRAAGAETGRKQIAEEAIGVLGGAGRDHHVARLQLLGHHMHHPVVAGLQQHGDRGAAGMRAWVDRPHVGLHQADAAHRLVDGGDAEARQLLDRRLVRANDVALDDAEVVHRAAHVHLPFAFRAASRRGNTRRALPS